MSNPPDTWQSMLAGQYASAVALIGGVFASFASWRLAFGFFAVAALILAAWILVKVQDPTDKGDTKKERFPFVRLSFLSAGVLCIAYAGADISVIRTSALAVLGVILLAWFIHADSTSKHSRLLPLNPISLRNPLGSGLTMILCFAIASIAITVYGPYLMVKLHNTSLLMAGYIVACSSIGWSLAAITISGLDESHDRRMILAGMGTLTLSILGFAYSVPNGPIWLIAVFALIEGARFGMAWTFILRLATNLADDTEKERIGAALPTVHRAGYAIGAAYIGVIANSAQLDSAGNIETIQTATIWVFIACLPFALLGLVATYRFTSGSENIVI